MVLNITTAPLLDNEGSPYGSVMVVRDESRIDELERDMKERRQFHNMIGTNEAMQKVYAVIEDLADIQTTVLITGESGTGKELIAEALHYKGARANKPLVKVNCSALSENLLESELFGHVKGAFTGAIKDRKGRFQMADGGSIFLDEIGDISPDVQLRLLRILQEGTFERVGDSAPVKVDVRIIAATNRDLQKEISLGRFREDLFYRLKVFVIKLPSLRERADDIPLLSEHLLLKHSRKLNKEVHAISEDVAKLFMKYPWPGNIRELENVLQHAIIVCRQTMITVDDLPQELKARPVYNIEGKNNSSILEVLNKTDWNVAKASRLLGMSRPTIYKKIKELRPG
jgi:transcriptional regulator with PAS, ATPase and Fis domain